MIAIMALFTGATIASFTKIIISLVEKMVGTSIESTVSNAAMGVWATMGAAGGATALATKFGSKFAGKFGFNTLKKGYQGSKSLAKFIRNRRGKTQ